MTGAVPDGDDLAGDSADAEVDALVQGWLDAHWTASGNTQKAYRGDMKSWRAWCSANRVDVLRAKKTDVEAWHQRVAQTPTSKTGRPPAKATVARMVSSIASFYQQMVEDDVVDAVPIRSSTRPRPPKNSTTICLSPDETVQMRAAAAQSGPLEEAIIAILTEIGMRVAELAGLDVGDYRWKQGKRTLVVIRKGDQEQELPISGQTQAAIDAWIGVLAQRAGVPVHKLDDDQVLFPNVAGGRYTQRSLMRMVRRLAKAAGISSWDRLSPHSLRHTAATLMLAAGVEIHVVQEILGHESVTTTQRYDRDRGKFERSVSGQEKLTVFLAEVAAGMKQQAA